MSSPQSLILFYHNRALISAHSLAPIVTLRVTRKKVENDEVAKTKRNTLISLAPVAGVEPATY